SADAVIARHAPARARVGDLHPPAAAAAAEEALEQRRSLPGGAAALAARPHVRAQPLAGGEVFGPGDIAGMMFGQADGPLLGRQLDRLHDDAPVGPEALLLPLASEDERPRVGRIREEVVHGAVA